LLEVNPLIVTKSGDLVALDAKINIDANAMFRQKAMAGLRDPSQEDPIEREASEHDPQLRLARRRHRLHGERRGSSRWPPWT
jgi:succinyl-CoA synthetase beta subunit